MPFDLAQALAQAGPATVGFFLGGLYIVGLYRRWHVLGYFFDEKVAKVTKLEAANETLQATNATLSGANEALTRENEQLRSSNESLLNRLLSRDGADRGRATG